MRRLSATKSRPAREKLSPAFYAQPAITVARQLLGKILVRRTSGQELRARITETEAYLGPEDLASHSSKGRTRRTEIMFGPAGYAYVYLIYGMHDMLNVVVGETGHAEAVLIRGAEPLDNWDADLSGPGRLTRAMRITRADNGLDLGGEQIYFSDDSGYRPSIVTAKRIGIDYAGPWKDALLRFLDADKAAPRR